MKNFLGCVFTHGYIIKKAPKTYLKYMLFCLRKRRLPNQSMLYKLTLIAYYTDKIKHGEFK